MSSTEVSTTANGADGETAHKAESSPWPARLWTILIAVGLVVGLYRESGTFSLLKGPVGVPLEMAFESSAFSPPSEEVLLHAALWTGVVVCALVLRRLRFINWPAAGVFSTLAVLAMCAQSSLWRDWGHRVGHELDQSKFVIEAPDVDFLELFAALGDEAYKCPTTREDGRRVVWIYPRIEPRVDAVIKMLEQKGYKISRKASLCDRDWVPGAGCLRPTPTTTTTTPFTR